MNEDIAPPVRLDRETVIKRRTDEPDTTGSSYARTWRRLWLWPSFVPAPRSADAIDKLLPAMAKAMYREGQERDQVHASGIEKAQRATDEAMAIASDALTLAEANARLLEALMELTEKHGGILEQLAGLHDRGAAMVPLRGAISQAAFEAEWAIGLHDRVNVDNGVVSTSAIGAEAKLRELSMVLTLPDEVMALPIPAAVRQAIMDARWLMEGMAPPPGLAPETDVAAAETDA